MHRGDSRASTALHQLRPAHARDAAPPAPALRPSARASAPPRRGSAPAAAPAMGAKREKGQPGRQLSGDAAAACAARITSFGRRQGRQERGLTFIQVWKVRSLTSRSFWRAPASSAQAGRRVRLSGVWQGPQQKPNVALHLQLADHGNAVVHPQEWLQHAQQRTLLQERLHVWGDGEVGCASSCQVRAQRGQVGTRRRCCHADGVSCRKRRNSNHKSQI